MTIQELKINNTLFLRKRTELKLSVRKVEQNTGVSRSALSNIETGKSNPEGVNLLRLMFFYDLSKEDVISEN